MNRLILCLTLCIIASVSFAQENKYELSKPLDIDQTGMNKVLCMKNGNTLLLHFEKSKAVMVKVFDSSHKLVATRGHLCRELDLTMFSTSLFKGLYDINGEAVFFVEQEHLSRHNLVMVRINGKDGKLIGEKVLGEWTSITKRTKFFVMKNKNEDGYAILYSTDNPLFFECNLHVKYFNGKHETIRDIPLEVDRKKFDYLDVVGAEMQPNGVCVTLGLSKLKTNGTPSLYVLEANAGQSFPRSGNTESDGGSTLRETASTEEAAAVYDHCLAIYYIPDNGAGVKMKMVDVSTEVVPYFSHYTYNSFAKTLNLMLLSYREAFYRFGIELRPTALTSNLFFRVDEDDMTPKFNWMNNKLADACVKEKTGKNNSYEGLPLKTFTNGNGLSTMISQSFYRYNNVESQARDHVYETYLGNIGITQFDDDGNEIWGTVLPLAQYYKSYQRYYKAAELAKKWQEQLMFADLPPQVYDRQFASLNAYSKDKNTFIVFNDDAKNFNTVLGKRCDTVFTFATANACYYSINSKKEVTKHYLFGKPNPKEYKVSFVEGADFDEQKGVYASLVQYKRNESVSLRMAWSHLE